MRKRGGGIQILQNEQINKRITLSTKHNTKHLVHTPNEFDFLF